MKIYVVRHGQTNWNVKGKIQGKSDIELNEKGIEQAKELKELIKNYDINLIISSPLKRAKQTAEIINENLKCKIIFDKALEERGYGAFEGKVRKEITDKVVNSGILHDYYANKEYNGVEPVQNLCNRVWGLFDKLKESHKYENVLLVSHGGVIRAIDGYFNGLNKDGIIENPALRNCEIKIYELN